MKTLLEKFEELRLRIPRLSLHSVKNVNCDYVNYAAGCKNCYLATSATYDEDCYYCNRATSCKDCVDCQNISRCTLCYECTDCANLYGCDYCQDCFDSSDCAHSYDLKGCQNCFGCVGLRYKKFHIYNELYSREEYFNQLTKILENGASRLEATSFFNKLLLKTPRLFSHQINAENCIGDYIYNSKNSFNAYIADDCEDCGYLFNAWKLKDCFDVDFCDESQLCYEVLSGQNNFDVNYCYACWYSSDLNYCDMCFNCSKCFLCAGLNKKKLFILNEEHSEKDFEKKFQEIKKEMITSGEWGKFFISPFPYKDSVASIYGDGSL